VIRTQEELIEELTELLELAIDLPKFVKDTLWHLLSIPQSHIDRGGDSDGGSDEDERSHVELYKSKIGNL